MLKKNMVAHLSPMVKVHGQLNFFKPEVDHLQQISSIERPSLHDDQNVNNRSSSKDSERQLQIDFKSKRKFVRVCLREEKRLDYS